MLMDGSTMMMMWLELGGDHAPRRGGAVRRRRRMRHSDSLGKYLRDAQNSMLLMTFLNVVIVVVRAMCMEGVLLHD